MANLFEKIFGLKFKKEQGDILSNKNYQRGDLSKKNNIQQGWTFDRVIEKFWWYFTALFINAILLTGTSSEDIGTEGMVRGLLLISFVSLLFLGIIVAMLIWRSYSEDKKNAKK